YVPEKENAFADFLGRKYDVDQPDHDKRTNLNQAKTTDIVNIVETRVPRMMSHSNNTCSNQLDNMHLSSSLLSSDSELEDDKHLQQHRHCLFGFVVVNFFDVLVY
uniref:Uncharacterized protein n=1 Tax=Romanomermis culicivorax TaxID=13658 RepID=A0A915JYG7_ROMCU